MFAFNTTYFSGFFGGGFLKPCMCDRHDKMASGFGNDHDIKRRNEMLQLLHP